MNRKFGALLIAGILLVLSAAAQADVEWADPPFDNILKTAKQQNKHIFLDFYAVWCGPCKRLDQVTYKDAKVMEFLGGTVAAKYDAEKDEGKELADKFRVVAFPTLVILDPEGKEIDRHIGYLGPEEFVKKMQGYIDGIETVEYYRELLKKNPDDIEVLFTLGMKHADAVRAMEAMATLSRVLALDPEDSSGHAADAIFALGNVSYTLDKYDDAEKYFLQLTDRFPDTEWQDRGLTRLARIYYKQDKHDKSIDAYTKYLDRHPDDPGVMNGFAWFCAQRKFGFEKALPVALKAVELSNRDAGILDTLAELYYAMGDYTKAIEIGEEAASKEPDDSYFKDQLKKYREAAEQPKEPADG
jgi:thiol-disulfide isomerase/thioredoxin/Flp pilus assembly protein TadD